MKKNTLKYVKYPSFHELIGVPLFTVKAIRRLIKKEKIEDSLSIIIEKSRQKANEMSEKEHSESNVALLEDDFTAFDDLFAKNFKSKQATKMCFEERIKYCLEKYREQSRNLSSATNSLILEENFLKGAQRILPLYFFFQNSGISVYSEENKVPVYQIHNNLKIEQNITNHLTKNVDNSITNYKIEQNNFTQNVDNSVINNYNKIVNAQKENKKIDKKKSSSPQGEDLSAKSLRGIFIDNNDYDVFYKFLEVHRLLPEKGIFKKGDKCVVAHLLLGLKKKGKIHQINGKELCNATAISFEDGISESTLSEAKGKWEGDELLDSKNNARTLLTSLYKEFKLEC